MEGKDTKPAKLRSLAFTDARIEALVDAKQKADPSLSLTNAIRAVFSDLEGENKALKEAQEAVEGLQASFNDVSAELAKVKAELVEKIAECNAIGIELDEVKAKLENVGGASKISEPFIDVEGLEESAANYIKKWFLEQSVDLKKEQGQQDTRPAMTLLHTLALLQHNGYLIPRSGEKIQVEWLKK